MYENSYCLQKHYYKIAQATASLKGSYEMKRIVILGSGGPAGVNFVNSLRVAPEQMYLIGTDINKYHMEWPDVDERYILPRFSDSHFIDSLSKLIKKTRAEMVHCQPTLGVKVLGEYRKEIGALTFLPDNRTIDICLDKFKLAEIWRKKGIHSSPSILIKTENDLKEAEDILGYPYWLRATTGSASRGSTPVLNFDEAVHWIGYWRSRETDWNFVAQEHLPGKNLAFQSVWKDGEVVTSQARERLEYIYPQLAPSGITNTPVVARTINRQDINQVATEAVLVVDKKATGVFCVDLKENKDGKPIPTEINAGRFFTTSFFFTKAGVNMPYIYVKLAYKEEIPDELPKYNPLPKGLYWLRHIDSPTILRREWEWRSKRFSLKT